MNSLTDTELKALVPRCRQGDRSAQEVVFQSLYGKMMAACMRYHRDRDHAQDVLQTGFIKVFTSLDKYNGEGSFEGWVRRIVVNTAIDDVRKKRYDEISIDADEYEWLEDESDNEIEWNHTLFKNKDRVMEALRDLSPAYRTVFNLYVIEGYAHKEIAEMLDINIGTSKSNLAKAKVNLRKALKEIEE